MCHFKNSADLHAATILFDEAEFSVPDMYDFHGIYRYSPRFASNWRAVSAFIIGCIPPLPGFVNNIVMAGGPGHDKSVSIGGQHL